MIFSNISFEPERHIVGEEQDVICTAILLSTAEYCVSFTWVAPDGVDIDDERVTILPTAINGNNHTSVLNFEYLMESDMGTYQCDVTSNNNTISISEELQDLYGK